MIMLWLFFVNILHDRAIHCLWLWLDMGAWVTVEPVWVDSSRSQSRRRGEFVFTVLAHAENLHDWVVCSSILLSLVSCLHLHFPYTCDLWFNHFLTACAQIFPQSLLSLHKWAWRNHFIKLGNINRCFSSHRFILLSCDFCVCEYRELAHRKWSDIWVWINSFWYIRVIFINAVLSWNWVLAACS